MSWRRRHYDAATIPEIEARIATTRMLLAAGYTLTKDEIRVTLISVLKNAKKHLAERLEREDAPS